MPCGMHGLWSRWNHTFGPNNLNAKYVCLAGDRSPRRDSALNGGGTTTSTRPSAPTTFHRAQALARRQHRRQLLQHGMGGQHEFKFGFAYRKDPARTTTTYAEPDPRHQRRVAPAPARQQTMRENRSGYKRHVQQGRMTASAASATTTSTPSTSPAAPPTPLPNLPELACDGSGPTITWKDFSPRLGEASSALERGETQTVWLRASHARYATALPERRDRGQPGGRLLDVLAYRVGTTGTATTSATTDGSC